MKPEDVPDEWVEAIRQDRDNVSMSDPIRNLYLRGLRLTIARVAPLIVAQERERCAAWLDAIAALSSDPNAIIMYREASAAIRATPEGE